MRKLKNRLARRMAPLTTRLTWEIHMIQHSWVHYCMSRDFYSASLRGK